MDLYRKIKKLLSLFCLDASAEANYEGSRLNWNVDNGWTGGRASSPGIFWQETRQG